MISKFKSYLFVSTLMLSLANSQQVRAGEIPAGAIILGIVGSLVSAGSLSLSTGSLSASGLKGDQKRDNVLNNQVVGSRHIMRSVIGEIGVPRANYLIQQMDNCEIIPRDQWGRYASEENQATIAVLGIYESKFNELCHPDYKNK